MVDKEREKSEAKATWAAEQLAEAERGVLALTATVEKAVARGDRVQGAQGVMQAVVEGLREELAALKGRAMTSRQRAEGMQVEGDTCGVGRVQVRTQDLPVNAW